MNSTLSAPAIERFPNAAALAEAATDVLAEAIDRPLRAGAGKASFVATGGHTPIQAYDLLHAKPLDWSRVAITLSDERWVPPDEPESNEGMLRQHLLKGPAAAARFTPLWTRAPHPEAAAQHAEPAIRALLPFDVVLLGMGEDGHLASLFPGSPALAEGLDLESDRVCIGVPEGAPAPDRPRISLTLKALLDSRLIVVLIAGDSKKRTLEAALGGADVPIRAVLDQRRTPVRILWGA